MSTLSEALRALLTGAEAAKVVEAAEALEARVAALEGVSEDVSVDQAPVDEFLAWSIRAQVPVCFDYTDAMSKQSTRTVSGYELLPGPSSVTATRLFRGWDHERDALRCFRIDRIENEGGAGLTAEYREPQS